MAAPGRFTPAGRRATYPRVGTFDSASPHVPATEEIALGVLVTQVFNGLSVGSILLLAALGLALTFGQMGVINMAHGEFIMAGAYTAYVANQVIGVAGLSLLVSLPVAFVVAGLLGVLLEVTLLRRMYDRPLDTLLVTWGVALVLQQLARDVFGTAGVDVPAPAWLSGPVEVLGFAFPRSRLFILVLSIAAFAALAAGLKFTSLGRRIRATVQNRRSRRAPASPPGPRTGSRSSSDPASRASPVSR